MGIIASSDSRILLNKVASYSFPLSSASSYPSRAKTYKEVTAPPGLNLPLPLSLRSYSIAKHASTTSSSQEPRGYDISPHFLCNQSNYLPHIINELSKPYGCSILYPPRFSRCPTSNLPSNEHTTRLTESHDDGRGVSSSMCARGVPVFWVIDNKALISLGKGVKASPWAALFALGSACGTVLWVCRYTPNSGLDRDGMLWGLGDLLSALERFGRGLWGMELGCRCGGGGFSGMRGCYGCVEGLWECSLG